MVVLSSDENMIATHSDFLIKSLYVRLLLFHSEPNQAYHIVVMHTYIFYQRADSWEATFQSPLRT